MKRTTRFHRDQIERFAYNEDDLEDDDGYDDDDYYDDEEEDYDDYDDEDEDDYDGSYNDCE